MHYQSEGLILKKIPYKDRHLICHMLLRDGHKVSTLFYGGQGGGKKKKSSFLEIGHLIGAQIQRKKSHVDTLAHSNDWTLKWHHNFIRNNYKAYYLLCFYMEMLEKIATDAELGDSDDHFQGLFRVGSNGVFYLEKSLENKDFDWTLHGSLFLGKLLFELGVHPQLEECVFCEKSFYEEMVETFIQESGGFACKECVFVSKQMGSTADLARSMHDFLAGVKNTKYCDYAQLNKPSAMIFQTLFHYLCYQFHLEPKSIKSFQTLLS